jgi:hypothetical protein
MVCKRVARRYYAYCKYNSAMDVVFSLYDEIKHVRSYPKDSPEFNHLPWIMDAWHKYGKTPPEPLRQTS